MTGKRKGMEGVIGVQHEPVYSSRYKLRGVGSFGGSVYSRPTSSIKVGKKQGMARNLPLN
jgi:hypothetical protein